jgi:dihydroflavonol-4-reductase
MPDRAAPRLYLTGGSGFIGCRLAQYARDRGYRVTATSAVNNDAERRRIETLARSGIPVGIVSLEDRGALLSSLRGQHVVVHLAAAQHEAHAPESYFRRINVEGTRRLLEAATSAGVSRFVHGSTIGVYGAAASSKLDESSPLAPDNAYGRTKADAESVVRAFADHIEVSIVRISETYGPADLRLLKLFRAIERRRYVTLGRGTNEHQPIYVDDLCEGLLRAASAPQAAGETIVLAGEEHLTTNAMVAMISAAVGRERLPLHVPLWPIAVAAQACEAMLKPLGLKAPLNPRRLDFFRKSFRFSTAKARALLEMKATVPFAEGARRTAEWYRAEGLLGAGTAVRADSSAAAAGKGRPSEVPAARGREPAARGRQH